MPFLDWVNKNQAKDTPREVPYHLLKREATYGDTDAAADNLIIQGDNLLALKALIPFYAGRVKCIFIDPPYNTKSAFEHYDDNLEHSQWLSMMYPRLVLLRELLAEDGSIWVTIDDNEAHYLKVLMDEVFGRMNFIASCVWQKRYSRENREAIGDVHDYILVYAKSPEKFKATRNRIPFDDEVERLRQQAMQKGFQGRLFEMAVPKLEDMAQYSFTFDPGKYPARNIYQGSYEFAKHFFPVIHDLREKTGAGKTAEEFRCAMAIDTHAKVKHWVRNIEKQPQCSFWLPTASDYFYPDFVAELTDGRVLVVEYKGEPYKTNDDSKEKIQVGHQWEKSSDGRCLFLFAVETDDIGRDVFKQLSDKLAG